MFIQVMILESLLKICFYNSAIKQHQLETLFNPFSYRKVFSVDTIIFQYGREEHSRRRSCRTCPQEAVQALQYHGDRSHVFRIYGNGL
jgi:hypothetical protein